MQKTFSDQGFPQLKRLQQETTYYCGPAVLQMLASFQGVDIDQGQLVIAAGVLQKICENGMTLEELGKAIQGTAPQLQFWFKRNSNLQELSKLVNECNYPVGIE